MTQRRTLLALAALLLMAAPSLADDRREAAIEMEKANSHLARHEYEEAIARFNVARKLVPSSSGPYLGLGLAYAATDRCREAVAYLEEYLQRQKSPKPEAEKTIAECRPKMVQPGRLKVTSDPSGAEVRIDEESGPPLGVTPYDKADLVKGQHRVFLTHLGYRTHVADVTVEPGVVSMVSASLETLSALPAPPPPEVDSKPPEGEKTPEGAKPADPTKPAGDNKPADESKPADGNKPGDPTTQAQKDRVASLDPAKPPEIVDPVKAATPSHPESNRPPQGATMVRVVDGELDLRAGDPLTSIYVNNEQVAADGHARLRLPPGLYGVKMERDGFRGSEGAVPLAAGDHKAFTGVVKPIKSNGWLSLGVGFTLLAGLAEGGALAGHFVGNTKFVGTDDFALSKNLEFYGQIAAGVFGAVALTGYIVHAVLNRGHVEPGRPYRIEPGTWPGEMK